MFRRFPLFLSLGAALGGFAHTFAADSTAVFSVSNPAPHDRLDELVTVSFETLGVDATEASGWGVTRNGEPVPAQVWDRDGDGIDDGLSLLLHLGAGETIELALAPASGAAPEFPPRVQAEVSERVGGHWEGRKYVGGEFRNVTELTPPDSHTDHSFYIRYEGPGWESDKVGYRFYLDWRNGFDIFGKLTPDLVLQQVGQDDFDSYHELADWGMDILKVGDAVGIGGFGYWNGESIERVSEVGGWTTRIVDNGPLWARVRTLYRDWQVAGTTLDLTAELRIGAGSRVTWVDLETSEALGPLATGLVKHPQGERLEGPDPDATSGWTYLATYGPQTLHGDDLLGMAVLVRREQLAGFDEDAHNHVVRFKESAGPLHYGFLAAWDQEPGGIRDKASFRVYLDGLLEKLDQPVEIEVAKP